MPFELSSLWLPANWQLIIPAAKETIYMVSMSTLMAYLLGLPLGVLLVITSPGHIRPLPWVERTVGTLINLLRSAPFIILLVALIPFTRKVVGSSIGTDAAIVPLVISAAPFVARMVESALKEIPFGVIEAALSMGASPWQIISKVLLAETKPALIMGGTITMISIIGYSAMAGAIGGGGLGDLAIQYGYNRSRTDIMLITVAVLILIVQLIQSLGNLLARTLSHR